jgi:hypothetical protein
MCCSYLEPSLALYSVASFVGIVGPLSLIADGNDAYDNVLIGPPQVQGRRSLTPAAL